MPAVSPDGPAPLRLRPAELPPAEVLAALEQWIRGAVAGEWLNDGNVTAIGIGQKRTGGLPTGKLSLVFSVRRKLRRPGKSRPIPPTIRVGELDFATDVEVSDLSVDTSAAGQILAAAAPAGWIRPGISVQANHGQGTIAALVRLNGSAAPHLLTCQHILRVPDRDIFSPTRSGRRIGTTARMAGFGGVVDAAAGRLDAGAAGIDPRIDGLGVAPRAMTMKAVHGQLVVKQGATTGRTWGVVREFTGRHQMNVGGTIVEVEGFQIEADATRNGNRHLSLEGDSGAAWVLANGDGSPTDVMLGLHVSGNGAAGATGRAFACHAADVAAQLGVEPWMALPVPETALFTQPLRTAVPRPAIAPRPMVVRTREPALMRGLPADTATILNRLPYGTLVDVLEQRDGWALVDLYGTGQADGYLWGDLLRPPMEGG